MTDHTPIGDLLRNSIPRHEAPAELRRWAEEQARAMDGADRLVERTPATNVAPPATRRRPWRPLGLAAALLLAAALGWGGRGVATRSAGDDRAETQLTSELIDSHVRSLMLDHLVDVRSSDHHTVKPWFLGKAELAPKVPELAAVGFPLVGGRMDFIGGHAAPVIVYQRRKHLLSLYMWKPAAGGLGTPDLSRAASEAGFHVLSWTADGVSYYAVSDVDPADLLQFRKEYLASP